MLPPATFISFLLMLCMASAQPRGGVVELTDQNFVKFIQSTPMTLVSFFSGNSAESTYENFLLQQLEQVAAALADNNNKIKFASVQASKSPALMKQIGIQGQARPIMLFRPNTIPQEYFGQRTGDAIAQYVMDILTGTPIKTISTKAEKKRYEEFKFAKVVAYIEPGSKMEKWYKLAGQHFMPTIPFYQVTDKKLAKSLHLKKPKAALFVKPNEKTMQIPSDVSDERSMIRFVYANRKQALMQLRMLEMHLTWSGALSPNLFMAVIRPKSDAGSKLFGTLKTVSKHFAKNDSLHLSWVDTESKIAQMLPQWSKTFSHDLTSTSAEFGFINLAQNKHAWLDVRGGGADKAKNVIQWMNDALSGELELQTTSAASAEPDNKKTDEEDFDLPADDNDDTAEKIEL